MKQRACSGGAGGLVAVEFLDESFCLCEFVLQVPDGLKQRLLRAVLGVPAEIIGIPQPQFFHRQTRSQHLREGSIGRIDEIRFVMKHISPHGDAGVGEIVFGESFLITVE